jgi:hypothetical protein
MNVLVEVKENTGIIGGKGMTGESIIDTPKSEHEILISLFPLNSTSL